MKIFLTFLFLDIPPPEPFKFGATGTATAIAFGLFLSGVAIGIFLLFRKKLATSVRALIAGILIIAAISGTFLIRALFANYDAEAERNRQPYRPARRPIYNEEVNDNKPSTNNNQNTTNSNTNTAIKR